MQVMLELLAQDAGSESHEANTTSLHIRTPNWFVDLFMQHKVLPENASRVSRLNILSRFAEHVEWIVDQLRRSDHPVADVQVWERWIPDVRRMRLDAAREGRRWGVWVDDPLPVEEVDGGLA